MVLFFSVLYYGESASGICRVCTGQVRSQRLPVLVQPLPVLAQQLRMTAQPGRTHPSFGQTCDIYDKNAKAKKGWATAGQMLSAAEQSGETPGGQGYTLLMLHGMGASRTLHLPQVRELCSVHRCVAPDLPGHGARCKEPLTLSSALAAVEQVVAEELVDGDSEAERYILYGVGMGGFIAMAYAARHPESVAGLVVANCGLNCFDSPPLVYSSVAAELVKALSREKQLLYLKQVTNAFSTAASAC